MRSFTHDNRNALQENRKITLIFALNEGTLIAG